MEEGSAVRELLTPSRTLNNSICKPDNLKGLFSFITENEKLDDTKKFKYVVVVACCLAASFDDI